MSKRRVSSEAGSALRRTLVLAYALVGTMSVAHVTSVRAQSLRGILVDTANAPVVRSAVMLLETTDRLVGSALTNERGEFQISGVVAGRYRLRTLRLGYSPVTLEEFAFAPGEGRRRFVSTARPFSLAEVRVVGRSTCSRGDASREAFSVWDQVRTALVTTSLSARERSLAVTAVMYERTLDRRGRTIEPHSATVRKSFVSDPWAALGTQALRLGYVVSEGDTTTYYAPGLETLSSDAFLIDHCINLIDSDDSSRVTIGFVPTRERAGVAEIRGRFSMDRRTAELRELAFGYTNIGRERERNAGGEMTFVRLPDGRWFITRWSIRMPVIVASRAGETVTDSATSMIRVTGGELALVAQGSDTLWTGREVAIHGTVSDAVSRAPVANVRVDLLGGVATSRTNAAGEFRMGRILPGSYEVELHTPLLDSIGLWSRVPVDVVEQDQSLTLELESVHGLAAALCGGDRRDSGVVMGRLRSVGGAAIPVGTLVKAQWTSSGRANADSTLRQRSFTAQARSDTAGRYRICGVPAGVTVALSVSTETLQSESAEILMSKDLLTRADLDVSARTSRAVFVGSVFSDSTMRPLVDAEVFLPDVALVQRTTAQGTFHFKEIELGTHRVIIRRIGYGSLDTVITFGAGERVDRRVVLSRIATLDSVRVVAERTRLGVGYAAFEERRAMGFGKFLDSKFLRANEHRKLQDLFADMPGVSLVTPRRCTGKGCDNPPPNMRVAYNTRMRCAFQVVLDGIVMTQEHRMTASWVGAFDLNAELITNIEAIEVYRSAAEVPMEYGGTRAACGVILLWSRQP